MILLISSSGSDSLVHCIDDGLQGIGFAHGCFFECARHFIGADVVWGMARTRTFDQMNQGFFMGSRKRLLAGLAGLSDSGVMTLGVTGPCQAPSGVQWFWPEPLSSCAMKSLL